MFERYEEHSRRTLFFARYEALQAGMESIEPEHLLLGLLRESDAVSRFARSGETTHTIRARLEASIVPRQRGSARVEVPFSSACQLALTQAAAEADALGNHTIRPEHLVLGTIMKANSQAARALHDAGVDPDAIRRYLRGTSDQPSADASVRRVISIHPTSGIARQWKGVVKPDLAVEYILHLHTETLPALHRLPGFAGASIMQRRVEDGTEFQVTTYWHSLEAIKAFAGDDLTRAVVPAPAQALMVRFDDRAAHYEIVQ